MRRATAALLLCWASLAAPAGGVDWPNTSRAFFVASTPACEIAPGIRSDCMHTSTCDCHRQCEALLMLGLSGEVTVCFNHTRTATSTLDDVLASPLLYYGRTRVVAPGANSVAEVAMSRGAAWTSAQLAQLETLLHPSRCPENCSMHGWCRQLHEGFRCQCFFDWVGEYCNLPRPSHPCINNCHGWGECIEGVCACKPGRHGVDCSLPLLHRDAADSQQRPRIYVYELPPYFNVWREMVAINRNPSYLLWERLLASPYRTARGEEADYFLLAVGPMGSVSHGLPMLAAEYVRDAFPYWNASGGKDHLIIWPWDFGACWTARHPSVRDAIQITHYGLVDTSAQDTCQCQLCGPHVPSKDIVIPSTLEFSFMLKTPFAAHAAQPKRDLRLFFSGKPTGSIRVRLLALDTHRRRDVVITQDGVDLGDFMLRSVFCIGAPGAGYGTRAVLAVIMGCIPVIVDDSVTQPWEDEVDWTRFSIKVRNAELDHLLDIVDAVPAENVTRMQAEIVCGAWRFFSWSSLWGSLAGEDGSSDAFELLMYTLRERKQYGQQRRKLTGCESVPDGLKPPRPLCRAGTCPDGLAPAWPHGGAATLAAATGRERKAELKGR